MKIKNFKYMLLYIILIICMLSGCTNKQENSNNVNNSTDNNVSIKENAEPDTELKFGSSDYINYKCIYNGKKTELASKFWGIYSFKIDDEDLFYSKGIGDRKKMNDKLMNYFQEWINSIGYIDYESFATITNDENTIIVTTTGNEDFLEFLNKETKNQGFHYTRFKIMGISHNDESSKKLNN